MSWRLADECGRQLADLALTDPRIWVLDGDLADSNGAIHFAERHEGRFVMAGISEQAMVSVAAGMASCGLRPFVFSFAAFLCYRAFDQIRVSVSQSLLPVTLIGSHSGGLSGRNGKTHAALNDVALMASLPHIEVWAPADPADVSFALRETLQRTHPVYVRTPRRTVPSLPGAAAVCRRFGDRGRAVIVSTGLGTHLALKVRAVLAQRGVDVAVLHCLRQHPLPIEELLVELDGAEPLFSLEDHSVFGGLGTALLHSSLRKKPRILGFPRTYPGSSGSDEEILRECGLDHETLATQLLGEIG